MYWIDSRGRKEVAYHLPLLCMINQNVLSVGIDDFRMRTQQLHLKELRMRMKKKKRRKV